MSWGIFDVVRHMDQAAKCTRRASLLVAGATLAIAVSLSCTPFGETGPDAASDGGGSSDATAANDGGADAGPCEARTDYFSCLTGTTCFACFNAPGPNPTAFVSCTSRAGNNCRSCAQIETYCVTDRICAGGDQVCTNVAGTCRARCAVP